MSTYRILGDSGGTAAAVTARLGVQPTATAEAGEPMRPGTRPQDRSHWSLASGPGPETGVELADSLARLLDVLEPARDALWVLEQEGYWLNWFCYLGSYATEHAAELDRTTLTRLLSLPGELWLDVYEDGPADEEDWSAGPPSGGG